MIEEPTFPLDVDARVRRVLVVTLALNLIVAGGKIVVGYAAAALAVRADGFHSLTDGLNNVVALFVAAVAARPPDREHPYGHRRYELFAAVGIGVSLVVMAGSVVRDALGRLRGELVPPEIDAVVLATLGVTLAVNVFVATWEHREGLRTGSALLVSDATHTRSDVVVTFGVIVASLLVRNGYPIVDAFAAFVVSAFIAWTGVGVLRANLGALADSARVDPERVMAAARAVEGVQGAHRVRSRGTPGHVFVDLHIELDGACSLEHAHHVTHLVIDAIKRALPTVVDVVVHTEPARPPASAAGVAGRAPDPPA